MTSSIEAPKLAQENQVYIPVPLYLQPTDTDHDAAMKVLFIDSETHEIRGPVIKNFDKVTIAFKEPKAYEFRCTDGSNVAYSVQEITGIVQFFHKKDLNGHAIQSAPIEVSYTKGELHCVNPKNGEIFLQPFSGIHIPLEANREDSISVG
jgi:hypothetical protein